MGIIIRAVNSDFSDSFVGFIPPVSDGLEGWFFHGENAEKSIKNYAPGKSDSVLVGAPSFGSRYAIVKQSSDYFQTDIEQPSAGTFITVVEPISENTTVAISNYASTRPSVGGTTFGATLQSTPGTAGNSLLKGQFIAYCWDGSDSGTSTNSAATDSVENIALATPQLLIGTYTGTSRKMYNKTTNTQATSTAGQPYPDIGGTLRLGSGYAVIGTAATHRQYLSVVYSRVLSDTEIATVSQTIRDIYARWGITV